MESDKEEVHIEETNNNLKDSYSMVCCYAQKQYKQMISSLDAVTEVYIKSCVIENLDNVYRNIMQNAVIEIITSALK